MRGTQRLSAIESSLPRLGAIAPEIPIEEITLIRLLWAAYQSLSDHMGELFRPYGFSESAFHILVILVTAAQGRASPGVLCDLAGQTPANMTRILNALTQQGLVTNSADQQDRRRRHVQITKAGRKCVDCLLPSLVPFVRNLASSLTKPEINQFVSLLRKLICSLDNAQQQLRVAT